MSSTPLLLDPALPADDLALLDALVQQRAPYRCYVEGPILEGFGAGLVRRHDALLHGIRTHVAAGVEESMEDASARSNLFRGVFAEEGQVHEPACRPLLHHPVFLEAARTVGGLPVIEPTMLYANVLLPGQELFVHTDTPEFAGLSKGHVPEWLLVVMHHSGLFDADRLAIAGGVTFLSACAGGAFRWWDAQGPHDVPPVRNTAVQLDADVTFHGVGRVGGPQAPAPLVRPGHTLSPQGDGWTLADGDRPVATYGPGEVRVSVQWKARCWTDEAARDAVVPRRPLGPVVDRLEADLRDRGLLVGPRPDDVTLGLLLIDTYVPFPAESAGIA
ncbi:MAG: hypothetical protein KC656_31275 [Myxococcales bacterium]|nr:hypothetical protein [Myxococcales bacterium]